MEVRYEKLVRAMRFAVYKHRLQRRKNKDQESYAVHPFSVEEKLERAGVRDENILCAAVLHDTVEDTEASIEEIRKEFGEEVAGIVSEVTDDKSLPKYQRKLNQIEKAKTISVGGLLVKLADKLDNLWDIMDNPPEEWEPERVEGYIVWCKAVTDEIGKRNFGSAEAELSSSYLLCKLGTFYKKSGVNRSNVLLDDYIASMKK